LYSIECCLGKSEGKHQDEGASMTLEEYWKLYSVALEEGISLKEVKKRTRELDDNYAVALKKKLQPISSEDTIWLQTALYDEKKKLFVLHIFYDLSFPLPKKLYKAMIQAAVYEINPSKNQYFVYPCVKAYGCYVVRQSLLEYVKNGDNFEKAGAVNALYWAVPSLVYRHGQYSGKDSYAQSVRKSEKYGNFRQVEKQLLLEEFVKNANVSVRRSIIAQLDLNNPMSYPEDIRPLIDKAIEIARNHPDEYIRRRVEIQLDSGDITKPQLLMALPDRNKEKTDE
jgi:hypothetical protein